MAKSNYLPRILFIAGICLCGYAGSSNLVAGYHQLPPDSHRVTTEIIKIYNSQVGIREQGTNAGRQVEEYLRYVNLKKGQPWCAAFICWVYGQAGVKNPRSGWSPDLFPLSKIIWTKAGSLSGGSATYSWESKHPPIKYTYPTRQARANPMTIRWQPDSRPASPGAADIFGIFFPEKNRIAHAGFIDQWDGTWLITVEGNTNLSGSREGDGVYRKRRAVKTIYRVARYIEGP